MNTNKDIDDTNINENKSNTLDVNSENNSENNSNLDDSDIEEKNNTEIFIKFLSSILDKDTFKSILEKTPSGAEKLNFENLKKEKDFTYLRKRYWQDIIVILIILLSIIILSLSEYIEKATLGTLLGSIIGYALGRFKNRHD